MSKNRFKAGDRVRIMADVEQPYNMWVEKGDTGVIVDGKPADGFECVKIDGCAGMGYVCIENKYLGTDETYDRKTDFLTRLSELMREFDVFFIAHKTDMPISAYFKGDEIPFARLGKENNKGCGVVITPYNLMDYDKG